jgi:hypothetical protein
MTDRNHEQGPRRRWRWWFPLLDSLRAVAHQFERLLDGITQGLAQALVDLGRASAEAPSGFARAMAEFLYVVLRGLDLSLIGASLRLISPSVRTTPRQRTLSEAIEALRSASAFVQELEQDLQHRADELVELQAQYERLEELALIEEKKAGAVLGEVESVVRRGRRREYLVAAAINLATGALLFFLGLWVGD